MDDHFNCNLCTMCVIAKSNWYVQNVKDWRSEFINQDFLNCILKWPFPVIAIMGYTKMLQRLNAKRCKIFYCCNIEKKRSCQNSVLNVSFHPFCTQNQMNNLGSYLTLTSNYLNVSWSGNFSHYEQCL